MAQGVAAPVLLGEASSHLDDFRKSLRAAVRAYWTGLFDAAEFDDAFGGALDRYLNLAWDEGAKRSGITPDDYEDEDRTAIGDLIDAQYQYLLGFAHDIENTSKAKGGKLDPLLARADAWANRYNDVYNAALVHFGEDQKLMWVATAGKQHCDTCYALIGWVKRASYWRGWSQETGISPQSHALI